jgi:hypothetical protein
MVTSVTKGRTQKWPPKIRLSKYPDMTIHCKALEEYFLMLPLNLFSEFVSKNLQGRDWSLPMFFENGADCPPADRGQHRPDLSYRPNTVSWSSDPQVPSHQVATDRMDWHILLWLRTSFRNVLDIFRALAINCHWLQFETYTVQCTNNNRPTYRSCA